MPIFALLRLTGTTAGDNLATTVASTMTFYSTVDFLLHRGQFHQGY